MLDVGRARGYRPKKLFTQPLSYYYIQHLLSIRYISIEENDITIIIIVVLLLSPNYVKIH